MAQVLIADDSSFMRRVLKEMLSEGGYHVISENQNGQEAIDSYKSVKSDLVLLDYNMPTLNGLEAARAILAYDSTACVVMVTAIGSKKKILEALRIGVKNYITKPFENYTFLATLKKVMGEKAPAQSRQVQETDGEFQVINSFFGQYLLQKGLLSEEQLLELLEIQSTVNRKFGKIAVEEGMLLPKHVDIILKMQKRINKYFGQLAIQMGLLSLEQVRCILENQQKQSLSLEEIISQEDMLSQELLQKELQAFNMLDEDDQGVFNMRWVSRHIQNGIIYEIFIEQTLKLIMRMAEIFVMEGECRFEEKDFISHGFLIKISLSGDSYWSYFLNLSEDLAVQIADAMLENKDDEELEGDISIEAANEFANIACGNAIAKLDAKGIKFEISPPFTQRLSRGQPFSFGEQEQVLCIPVLVPTGEMELIITGTAIFCPMEIS